MRVGVFRRMAVFMIDLCLFLVLSNTLSMFYPKIRHLSEQNQILLAVLLFTMVSLIPMLRSSQCQSVGMKVLRVAMENRTDLPKSYFLIRHYFYWLVFGVFYVFIIFSRKRVTLYDQLSGARYYLIPKTQSEIEPD